ncbi:MAG TPA: DUF4410 domain-containing protein [Myxococcota bacterium]|nr:DUF4410 domain-containing protein [Myxococcota bacterium]
MNSHGRVVVSVLALALLQACAGTKVSQRDTLVKGRLPRPDHIYVYDFAAAPADVPPESALTGHPSVSAQPQTPQHIALGRKVGSELAGDLASEIAAMGLPAIHVTTPPLLEPNDIAIRGTLLSVVAGSAAERVVIGFGEGSAELKVAVEGFEMTANGLREVGSGTVDTTANKTPGAAVPLAVAVASGNPIGLIVSTGVKVYGEESGKTTIEGKVEDVAKATAEQLRPRFVSAGWIAASPR